MLGNHAASMAYFAASLSIPPAVKETHVCRFASIVPTYEFVTPKCATAKSVSACKSESPIKSVISSVFKPYFPTTSILSASVSPTGMRDIKSLTTALDMAPSIFCATCFSTSLWLALASPSPLLNASPIVVPPSSATSNPAAPTRCFKSTSIIFVRFATWSSNTFVLARLCSRIWSIFFWLFLDSSFTARCTSSTALIMSASLAFMNSRQSAFFSGSAAIAAAPPSSLILSCKAMPCSKSFVIMSCASIDAAAAMTTKLREMLSLKSLNFSQSRPLVSICDTKYLVFSLWQNARPSSISN
mmetsp:Transcript_7258/g.27301  ORF Transcript_7258/g.27301 Transcript_7258/m.27301 type:complete len:300 (+) Transcript_7258:4542-5441(+)